MKRYLFVYGTLMTGGRWHHLLVRNAAELYAKGEVQGELFVNTFSGNLPCFVRSTDPKEKVKGEVYLISGEGMEAIERFEGPAGYQRETITVKLAIGAVLAAVFVYVQGAKEKLEKVKDGDYKEWDRKARWKIDVDDEAWRFWGE